MKLISNKSWLTAFAFVAFIVGFTLCGSGSAYSDEVDHGCREGGTCYKTGVCGFLHEIGGDYCTCNGMKDWVCSTLQQED